MTPLPKLQLFILSIVILCEPVAIMLIYPILISLVKFTQVTNDPKDYGFYAGLIGASFSFAQVLTSIPWSYASDKIGRRPVILLGLTGNIITAIWFGLSGNFWFCLAARCTAGFVNGNVAVAKCMLGEITDKTNQSVAFGVFGFLYNFGLIIGSILGGILADPINQYPSIFGDSVFLKQHPFFLIMLASSLVSFIGLVAGSLWLKESKNFNRNIENDPLLASDSRDTIEQTESNDSTTDSTGGIRGSLFPILTAAMLNLIYNTYFEVYSIFLASSKETSGLGFSASNISIVFFISGIIGIIVQLLYVYLERLLGGAYLGLQLGMLLHIPTLGTTGLIYYLKDTTIQIIVLSIYSIMRSICGSIAFTSSMLLLNNSAQSNLARINGVSQTITCLTRSIGPAMGGLIWSWSLRNEYPFDFQFVFYLTGLCSFFGFWLARLVPREYDSVVKKEEEDVDIY